MVSKTYNSCTILVRPQSPTAETPVWIQEEDSYWNNILLLGNCVDKRLALGSYFGISNSQSSQFWPQRTCMVCSYRKWQLNWMGRMKVCNLLGGTLDILHVHGCKRGVCVKDYGPEFWGGMNLEVWQRKPRKGVESDQANSWVNLAPLVE